MTTQNAPTIDKKSIMATLGRITRLVYGDDEIPTHILHTLLSRPLAGLGLMGKTARWREADKKELEELMFLMHKLPGNFPANMRMSIAYHGHFWLAYYQFERLLRASKQLGGAEFAEIGKALFGEHWQKEMASALQLSDTARIRAWLSGKQRIPAGVWSEVMDMLRHKQIRLETLEKVLQGVGRENKS